MRSKLTLVTNFYHDLFKYHEYLQSKETYREDKFSEGYCDGYCTGVQAAMSHIDELEAKIRLEILEEYEKKLLTDIKKERFNLKQAFHHKKYHRE